MSLFTDLVAKALAGGDTASTQSQTQNLLQGALEMLDRAGGVQAVAQKFQQSGLGDLISSWIGTGENKPISPDQLAGVLGQDQIDALSQQAGVPREKGAGLLTQILPALVDKLTPAGEAPQSSSQLMTLGKVILGGLGVAAAAKAAASVFGRTDEETGAPPADFSDVQAGFSSAAAGPAGSKASGSYSDTSRAYTVVSGDTLSKIAKNFYGDANAWSRIFDANRDQLSDPNRIFPGQVIRIP